MKRLTPLFVLLACSAAWAQTAPAARSSARDRLMAAAGVSADLAKNGAALPDDLAKMLQMEPLVREDRPTGSVQLYARQADVSAYGKSRPWQGAYAYKYDRIAAVESWPVLADAAELRALLSDKDPAIRSLAVEALATLRVPADVPRIAALLDDKADGAMVLAWAGQRSSTPAFVRGDNPLVPTRQWRTRTVQTYAREGLRIMTGYRFDGDNPKGIAFADWWKTHNFGADSLWYWQQRLDAEAEAFPPTPEGVAIGARLVIPPEVSALRVTLHDATVKELAAGSPEVEAKIFLLTHERSPDIMLERPINAYFPEGIKLRISAARLVELAEGKNIWPDAAEAEGRQLMLLRIAQVAPDLFKGAEHASELAERLQAVLEKEAAGARWMPPLVSRLLPRATTDLNDPKTREGYLQKSLAGIGGASAPEGYACDEIIREMVRDAMWQVVQKYFYTADAGHWDARQAILQALGEAPHTPAKTKILADWIKDPRNETVLTQGNLRMGMDMYRQYAIWSLNAIAGKEIVPGNISQDLATPEHSKQALEELRRVADGLAGAQP